MVFHLLIRFQHFFIRNKFCIRLRVYAEYSVNLLKIRKKRMYKFLFRIIDDTIISLSSKFHLLLILDILYV